MNSSDSRPPLHHPVFGALGARADGELARLGVRREDFPWRGLVLRVGRDDVVACFGEGPNVA